MSIFLTENSKVIVQGITGSEGRKHTARMLASGTAVVGGYLIHAYGYQLAFLAMSCGFVGCTAIWVPLALIERRAARRDGSGGGRE